MGGEKSVPDVAQELQVRAIQVANRAKRPVVHDRQAVQRLELHHDVTFSSSESVIYALSAMKTARTLDVSDHLKSGSSTKPVLGCRFSTMMRSDSVLLRGGEAREGKHGSNERQRVFIHP
jgi:hypothetical protein